MNYYSVHPFFLFINVTWVKNCVVNALMMHVKYNKQLLDKVFAISGIIPGGGYSLIWPIRGCAAGQGMVCGLSVLNRVCDFVRVCPKQGI